MITTTRKTDDVRMRELERQAASGDLEAKAQLRLHRIRRGEEQVPEQRYKVLELHLGALRKKIDSLAKRAVKMGQIPVSLWVSDEREWIERETPDGGTARLALHDVAVIGDQPVTDEWEFIACLHHKTTGTVIQRAPFRGASFSERELEIYRDRGPVCDHCDLRRNRNDTYVLRHKENHSVVQVGRTCLEQFLGCSPRAALYVFDLDRQITEMLQRGRELDDSVKPEWGCRVETFVAALCRRERVGQRAWGSQAQGDAYRIDLCRRANPDADLVALSMAAAERFHYVGAFATADVVRAEQILADAAEHLKPGDESLSDADHNLAVTIAEGTIPPRHARIAEGILGWHRRFVAAKPVAPPSASRVVELLKAAGIDAAVAGGAVAISPEELVRALTMNGELSAIRALGSTTSTAIVGDYLAPIGEEISGSFMVNDVRYFNAASGGRRAVVKVSCQASGLAAVWFTTAAQGETLARGSTINIAVATVGRHSTYCGTHETVLDRVRLA